jgi:hypothetical protein
MEVTTLAMEVGRHGRWRWHGMMMTVTAEGYRHLYSYMPADVEVFPDLLCKRVRGFMLADIFLLAQEVHYRGGWMHVVMGDRWMCVAKGVDALPSCWLAMSRYLEAHDGGATDMAE